MTDERTRAMRRHSFGTGVLWIAFAAGAGAVFGLYLAPNLGLHEPAGLAIGVFFGAAIGAGIMATLIWVTAGSGRTGQNEKGGVLPRTLAFRLGLIGGGNMAEAIVRGILASGGLRPRDIRVSDPLPERRNLFAQLMRVKTCQDNCELAAASDVIILAVKPQVIDQVMAEIGPLLGPKILLVSIAAGTTIGKLASHCAEGTRIIRTMPNTPMLVGRGMVAMSLGQGANQVDADLARHLLAASATVIELPEEKMDAVTAVSGSGPAYFFLLVEALISAGQQVGLSHQEAVQLAETTFAGAAELLASGDVEAAELRRRVTSPGGTTEAAIKSFTADQLTEIVAKAVAAACARSRELAG